MTKEQLTLVKKLTQDEDRLKNLAAKFQGEFGQKHSVHLTSPDDLQFIFALAEEGLKLRLASI